MSVIPDWRGCVLVDANNLLAGINPFSLGDISGRTSSEIVADLAPGAKVVKAFNSVLMAWVSEMSADKPRTVLFISGDDGAAMKPIADLIEQVGLACIVLREGLRPLLARNVAKLRRKA